MGRGLPIVLLLVLIGLSAAAPPAPYQAGQVWEYHTRPGDDGSLLKIQSVETDPADAKKAPIYHITVIGVHFHGSPLAGAIGHLPVAGSTLDASVTRPYQGAAEFPGDDQGIAEWRRAQGGVFTIAVAEIIEVLDKNTRPAPLAGGSTSRQ